MHGSLIGAVLEAGWVRAITAITLVLLIWVFRTGMSSAALVPTRAFPSVFFALSVLRGPGSVIKPDRGVQRSFANFVFASNKYS